MVSANWFRRLGVFSVTMAFAMIATSQANAGLVIGTFDLTSTGTVVYSELNNNYPATFNADTGITVKAYAGYDGEQNSIKTNIHTASNGAGVVGDAWIEVTDRQRLEFDSWSVNGRLVGFTLQEDDVRNGFGSSAQLFGGASGTTLIGTWDMTNGETLVVDLSSYSGLDQTNLFNFRTTVDVNSSFAVKELKWEYNATVATVPEPASIAIWSVCAVGGMFSAGRTKRRRTSKQ